MKYLVFESENFYISQNSKLIQQKNQKILKNSFAMNLNIKKYKRLKLFCKNQETSCDIIDELNHPHNSLIILNIFKCLFVDG